MDLEAHIGWIFKFWEDRKKLRISVESFVDWIDNKNKTWEVDIYFMFVHLITLDKYLIVRTVGVRENRRQLFAKCVLKVMVTKYTNACHDDHICAGPKEELTGTYMTFNLSGTLNLPLENWIFLLADVRRRSTKSIALEYCGRFTIYGRPELF